MLRKGSLAVKNFFSISTSRRFINIHKIIDEKNNRDF